MPDTFKGYAITCPTCPTCGNPDAYSIPRVVELQGVGEGGLVSYTHTINCRTCTAADNVLTRERWGRNARGEIIGP